MVWWLVGSFFGETSVVDTPANVVTVAAKVPATAIESDAISANVRGLQIANLELKNHGVKLLDAENEFAEIGMTVNGTTGPTSETLWRTTRRANNNSMMWRKTIRKHL